MPFYPSLLALISLLDKNIIECDFVNDPILGYLLERYRDLSGAGIEKQSLTRGRSAS